jgi:hypothetical protein
MAISLQRIWNPWTYSLAGLPFGRWRQLRRQPGHEIDAVFAHRAAFHTAFSLVNSVFARREQRLWGARISAKPAGAGPVFVIGHHRSGTTHLHNLLALTNPELAYPNAFDTAFPFALLSGERPLARLLGLTLSPQRPMDRMALHWRLPQEDEFALNQISLHSPYLSFSFPRALARHARYVAFDEVPEAGIARWQESLQWYMTKLALKYGRRLVLKSPYHTARIGLVRQVFPEARFIHVFRHPCVVFQSMVHMMRTLPWTMCLQDLGDAFSEERIIEQYRVLYDAYFSQIETVPMETRHEIRYETLVSDPVPQLAALYEKFGWAGWPVVEGRLRQYLRSVSDYRVNTHPELPEMTRRKLAREWRRTFEAWGYSPG